MISFDSIKHKYMIKSSLQYRKTFGRHYIEYGLEFKNYHYNKVNFLPEHFKFIYEIDSNLCLYKEIFDGKNLHIFKVKEIKCVKLFHHQRVVKNGKFTELEFSIIVDYQIINEKQELENSNKVLQNYEQFTKLICNNSNIFKQADKLFNEVVEQLKPDKIEDFDVLKTLRLN